MGTPHARAFVLGAVLTFAGCGGASDGPPGPLARHFDEMQFLGGIPVDQRADELAAKGEYDKAQMKLAKENSDLDQARVWLDVASNERKASKLDEASAKTRQKAAQESADQTRIKAAETEMEGARLAADAADKRFAYLTAYINWKKRTVRYAQHEAYWREAQYELVQAKIAAKNNIQPAGFNLDNFVKQEADRNRKTQDAKQKAEAEKSKAMSARSTWLALQKQSDKLLGKASDYPDPLDPGKIDSVKDTGYTVGGGEGVNSDKEVHDAQDPTMKDPGSSHEGDKGGGGDEKDDEDEDQADPDEGGE